MGISDKNDIIYLSYDSIVEYGGCDYTVIGRFNISNPVVSFLMYELEFKGGRRYLWYDKREPKISVLAKKNGNASGGFDSASYKLMLNDSFQRQDERKSGAPEIYPVVFKIYVSADGEKIAVVQDISGNKTIYEGETVSFSNINIFPYSN